MESAKIYPLSRNRFEGGTAGSAPETPPKPKLLDQVREAIRARHYSPRTEEAYVHWIKRFIFFHNKRHPAEMSEAEIAAFLSSLASESHVSASTQNQAFNALLFLYQEVLHRKIGLIEGVVRAKRPSRLPVVLTKEEVGRLLARLEGAPWLMAMLLYGAGLRLMECCRLRVKDIDFSKNQIVVRAGKGNKDRYTMLPTAVKESLLRHFQTVKRQHEGDLKAGLGRVSLPNAWTESTRMPARSGAGSGCSRPPAITPTRSQEKSVDTTSVNRSSRRPSKMQGSRLASGSQPARTPCVILLQPTYWRTATTSGRFKNCSGTPMCRPP